VPQTQNLNKNAEGFMISSIEKDPFSVRRQHFLPQHLLSRFAGLVSHCPVKWLKNEIIRRFINHYQVDMEAALAPDYESYRSFHDFFTRHLKPDARPIDPSLDSICSPSDGVISEMGEISGSQLLQAKGRSFSLGALLGCENDAKLFENGHFMTIYLAPKDYHRVHMPFGGKLLKQRYIPGKLFSVNPLTAKHVDNLFARNERVVTLFNHPQGDFAVILVGAMLVGSITTTWGGTITPSPHQEIVTQSYPQTEDRHILLNKGEEMGYFSLGSTVIVLFPTNVSLKDNLSSQSPLVVGQAIGQLL
jgi:phosphatidylserine decarboxylase